MRESLLKARRTEIGASLNQSTLNPKQSIRKYAPLRRFIRLAKQNQALMETILRD
jgi:hypothetical protein